MLDVVLFAEDFGHQAVIGTLVKRIAEEHGIKVRLDLRSARHGHGKVASELKIFFRDLDRQSAPPPGIIVVAIDANCTGLNERERELKDLGRPKAPVALVYAIPDPHVERWLLLDGAAFRSVFGRGCRAPDRKCERARYKQLLIEAILATGSIPVLGGLEHASDIVREIDIERASRADRSFKRFVDALRDIFQGWQQ